MPDETVMNRNLRAIFLMAVLIAFSGVGVYSQTLGDVLERARTVKFLQADQIAVKQAFYEMTFDGSFHNRDDFTYGDFGIEVYYSTGECDEYEDEIFQAEKGTVVRIVISPSDEMSVGQLGFDLAKLKKEQKHRDSESTFIYHDKKLGLAVDVSGDHVEEVILFPSVNAKATPCGNDMAREFVRLKSWFGSTKLEDRTGTISCWVANVTALDVSETLVTALTPKRVSISTTATDPENDVLTYVYVVSAGRIIGTGKDVVWDLTSVPSGTYTITAGVDDGCGVCGTTVTKTVTVQ
jgi:hypothetical protein